MVFNKSASFSKVIITLLYVGVMTFVVGAPIALLIGCGSDKGPPAKDDPRYYQNLDMIIIEKAGYVNSSGKYTSLGKYFLLKGVQDTTLYWEYHGLYNNLSDSVYYNHKVGDWLHFDYVFKSRFFHKIRR